MQRSWTKYGPETFGWAILEIVEDTELLLQREQAWLDEYRPEFNIATEAGKVTGFTFSEKQKEAARARATEMWSDEKFRKETAAKIKAGWADPETRAARSRVSIEHWANPENRRALSEKIKKNLSTEEARAARSEQRRRDWQDPEKRERILAGRRAARERRLLRANAGDQE